MHFPQDNNYITPRLYDSHEPPSKSYREHNPYSGYQSLKPEHVPSTKHIGLSRIEDIYARICPDRPMSAVNFAAKSAEFSAGTVFHKENRGLRSEGKFSKFMDGIRDARMQSEALLQKHADEVHTMHVKPPEKVDLKDYMRKNYLQIDEKKTKNTRARSSKDVELAIQAKNFKTMKRALDEIEYEKQNPKKVVKHLTGKSKLDPTVLAQPKFISYEFKEKERPQPRAFPVPTQKLSYDQAMRDLVNLNMVKDVEIPTEYSTEEDVIEHNLDKIRQFQDNLSFMERCSSAKKPLKVITDKEDLHNNQPKKPLHFRRPPKSALYRKTTHKKQGVEMRTQEQKPLEDFLQESPQSAMIQRGVSPTPGADFSISKMSLNLSNFGIRSAELPRPGVGIFGNTQAEMGDSRYDSPLRKAHDNTSGREEGLSLEAEDDRGNELLFRKQEKIKKILQSSPQGKHIRVQNDVVLLKERYNVQIESLVNPQNASKVATETKASFFKDLIGDNVRHLSPRGLDKTKLHVFNSYKMLSKACESNEKQKPALRSTLQKGFKLLEGDLRKINDDVSWQVELNNQIKQDIFAEMQVYSSMPPKVRAKPKKASVADNKKR